MEVRERKTPREANRNTLPTVVGEMYDAQDYEAVPEAEVYIPPSRPISRNQQSPYPVKPAFPSESKDDSFDDTDDEDDLEDMAMMTTCCFCCSTKNGSMTVGIICLILGFLISVVTCFALINVTEFQGILRQRYEEYENLVAQNKTADTLAIVKDVISINIIIDNLQIVFIICLVFYSIYTFSCLFLTYGACSDLRTLLLPWIVLEFVPFSIQLAGIVLVFVSGKDDPTLSQGGVYIIIGLAQIVCFVIHVYWWMCPVAHYQNMKETTEVQPLVPRHHPMMYPNVAKY